MVGGSRFLEAPAAAPGLPDDGTGPFDRRRPRVWLAIVLGVIGVVGSAAAGHRQPDASPIDVLALALLLVSPVVLATIPRRHVLAAALSLSATAAYLFLGYPWGPVFVPAVGVLVAIVLTGPAVHGRLVAWSGAIVLAGVTVGSASLQGDPPFPGALFGGLAWTCVALLVAGGVRERMARIRAARAVEREHELNAVTAERLRIARELHDVLAHSLSAINVQAGVGLHLLDRDTEQARDALAAIRTTSREALDEVRDVLGIVRAEGGSAPRSPSWDLSALPRLVEQASASGIDVTLTIDPAIREETSPPDGGAAPRTVGSVVPARLAGVAYRVVQESLTNVQRHAVGATRVAVGIAVVGAGLSRVLLVTVSDDGAGPSHEPAPGRREPGGQALGWQGRAGEGYGLRGMRERVEGVGGTLTAGHDPDSVQGFVVEAQIPWPGEPDTTSTAGPAAAPTRETP